MATVRVNYYKCMVTTPPRNRPPPLWKCQLGFTHSFKFLVIEDPPSPRISNPICVLEVGGGGGGGGFGDFLEL